MAGGYKRSKTWKSLRKMVRYGIETMGEVGGALAGSAFTESPIGAAAGGYIGNQAAKRMDDYILPIEDDGMDMQHYDSQTMRMAMNKKYKTKRVTIRKTYKKYKPRMIRTQAPKYTPETKHWDIATNMALSVNGTYTLMGVGMWPIQGTDFNNRIGRKIKLIGIDLTCLITVTAPAQMRVTGDTLHCSMWMDKETRGGTASVSDIFANSSGALNVLAPVNMSNKQRFRKIHESKHNIVVTSVAAGVTTGTDNVDTMRHFIKMNEVITFNNNVGNAGDVVDNSFVLTACPANPTVATSAMNFAVLVRYHYIDL